jgi:hypothetical protein
MSLGQYSFERQKTYSVVAKGPLISLREIEVASPSFSGVRFHAVSWCPFQPFVDVVASRHTSGPITGAALSSLHKFLLYGFITKDALRARDGINLIARGSPAKRVTSQQNENPFHAQKNDTAKREMDSVDASQCVSRMQPR